MHVCYNGAYLLSILAVSFPRITSSQQAKKIFIQEIVRYFKQINKHSLKLLSFLCPVPEVCDLESELHEVIDWIPLGLYLGIELPELKIIEANYPTLKSRRIEMFERRQPTWFAMVQALNAMGMKRLAFELAQKHGWFRIINCLPSHLIPVVLR